ncbi:hypothetical protein FGM00_02755 [Aggregatimonas sangjinii]|uniref:Uncharacterized protein n=1 Tax=Aggregatimonas sangjinii TaxID=2583587 RepID=A0A5B7SQ08_9FLAO|nr:hypothetical protein [Aggregatimonas sangjinii]QCW99087.1 hypothetical protein FGM00_02755 [Aggregatimonas sangjinii]
MEKSKVFKLAAWDSAYPISLILMIIATLLQSCSKTEDFEQLTYSGRVLVYNGPEIGQYEALNTVYLEPLADEQVFILSCEPWTGATGGGCTPKGSVEETDRTNDKGEFSISFRANVNFSYYPQIDYRSEYVDRSEGYSDRPYKEIILVPRSLIK